MYYTDWYKMAAEAEAREEEAFLHERLDEGRALRLIPCFCNPARDTKYRTGCDSDSKMSSVCGFLNCNEKPYSPTRGQYITVHGKSAVWKRFCAKHSAAEALAEDCFKIGL